MGLPEALCASLVMGGGVRDRILMCATAGGGGAPARAYLMVGNLGRPKEAAPEPLSFLQRDGAPGCSPSTLG